MKSITVRAWAALGVLGAILLVFFLPLSWKQAGDAAAAWGPVLQSPSLLAILLLVYAVLLTAWLFWIDIRPELHRRREAKAAMIPETAEAAQLKEEVVNFGSKYVQPAFENLTEAHRISAYVIKDSWDHPAKFLIWQAFATLGNFDGRYYQAVSHPKGMMTLSKKQVQAVTIELLKQYYQKQHRLVDAVKILTDNGKPLTPHNFDQLLRTWVENHDRMLIALKRIQAIPGLELMQEFDTALHLEHANYRAQIIQDALNA